MVVTRREGIGLALLVAAQICSLGTCASLPALPLAASNDEADTIPAMSEPAVIRANTLGQDNTTAILHKPTTTSSRSSSNDKGNHTEKPDTTLLQTEARMYRDIEDYDNYKSSKVDSNKNIYPNRKFVSRSDKEVWDLFQKRKEYYMNSIGKQYNNINRTSQLDPSLHSVKLSHKNNAIVRFPDIENSVSNVYAAVGEYSDQIGGPSNTFENIDPSTFVLVDVDKGFYRPNDDESTKHIYIGNVDRFDDQIVDDGKILSSYGVQQDEPNRILNVTNSDDKLDDDDNLNQFINISFLNVTDANDDDRLEVEKTKNVLRTVVKKVLGLYHETSGSLTASHSMKLDGKTYHTAVALSFGKPYKHKITEVPFSGSNEEQADSPSHFNTINHSENNPIQHGDEQQDNTSISDQDPTVAEQHANMSEENTSAAEHATNVGEQETSASEENTSVAEPSLAVENQHTSVAEQDTSVAEQDTSVAEQDTSVAEQNSNSNEGGSSGPRSGEGSKSVEDNDEDDRNIQNDGTHDSHEQDKTTPSSTTQYPSTEPLRSNSKLTRKPSTTNFFTTESSNEFPVDSYVPLKPIQKPARKPTTTFSPPHSYENDEAENDSDQDDEDYFQQNFAFVTPKPKPVKVASQRKPMRVSTANPADLIIELYSDGEVGSDMTDVPNVTSKPRRKPPKRHPDTYKLDGGFAENDLETSKDSFEYGTIASTTTTNHNQVNGILETKPSSDKDVLTNKLPGFGYAVLANANNKKNSTDSNELDLDSDDCDDDDDEYDKDKSVDDITVDSYEGTGDSTSIDYDSVQYDSVGDYDSEELYSLEKGGYRSAGESVEDGSNYESDEDGYRELRSKTEVVLMNDTKISRTLDDEDEEGNDVARVQQGNGRRNTRFMNGPRRRVSKKGINKKKSLRENKMVGDLERKGDRMLTDGEGKTGRKRRRSRRKNEGLMKDAHEKNGQVMDMEEKLRELSKISKVTL